VNNFIGDILIAFNSLCNPSIGRTNGPPWHLESSLSEWELYSQPPSPTWKGFPYKRIQHPEYEITLLGEVFLVDQPKDKLDETFLGIARRSESANLLNGHCLLLVWNKLTNHWHVWTNRLGTLHLYYAFDGSKAALGTFFPSVAQVASAKQCDADGLTGFFNFGFFPQDRTHYKDVKVLRPASEYEFNSRGLLVSHKRYWDWNFKPDYGRTFNTTVSELNSIFREVISDQTDSGRVAIPISGGLDSRTIVGALNDEASQSVYAYSYGYTDSSVEVSIARKIALSSNLNFRAFTIQPYLFDEIQHVTSCLEGFNDMTQCRQADVMDQIGHKADYVLGGHLGDLILDDAGLLEMTPNNLSESDFLSLALKKTIKKGADWLNEKILANLISEQAPDTILGNMTRDEIESLKTIADYDFRMKVFKMEQYCFRFTATGFRMYQPGAFPRLPFYDNRIIDFISTIPSSQTKNRKIQIELLKRYYPDLAKIKWQKYDANLYQYQHFDTWLLPGRFLKKATRKILKQEVIQRNWEVQFLNPTGKQGLYQWLLSDGLRLHDFVEASHLEKLLASFYQNPTAASGYTVSMLLTLSAWLERQR